MSAEIINLAEEKINRQPHMRGDARCIMCKHEWVAVAPAGTCELECPQCLAYRGYFMGAMITEDKVEYNCECGCNVYKIGSEQQVFCAKCGITHGHIDFLED